MIPGPNRYTKYYQPDTSTIDKYRVPALHVVALVVETVIILNSTAVYSVYCLLATKGLKLQNTSMLAVQ
jgi:hypothetical protein